MPEKTVLYTVTDHVALVRLNRPRNGNVVDWSLAQELLDACVEINQDEGVHIAVVTGAGEKAFCVGSELERMVQGGRSLGDALDRLGDADARYEVASGLAAVEKPVIAAINGDAFGQGLELALSCDIRIAGQNARLGFPQTIAGLMPMDGGTQRLPRLIGKGKALELILSGEIVSAEEALAIGLVSQVVPQKDVIETATSLAKSMASKAPIAMRYVKEAVNKGMDLTLDQGIRLEADLYFLIHTTADRTEGVRAFQEKRKPEFKGR
jgi:enoyl-CoA hydratase/carnithine racemase